MFSLVYLFLHNRLFVTVDTTAVSLSAPQAIICRLTLPHIVQVFPIFMISCWLVWFFELYFFKFSNQNISSFSLFSIFLSLVRFRRSVGRCFWNTLKYEKYLSCILFSVPFVICVYLFAIFSSVPCSGTPSIAPLPSEYQVSDPHRNKNLLFHI
jgi:hypothetical protein